MNIPAKAYSSHRARELAAKYHLKLKDIPASNKKTNKVTIKNVRNARRLTKSKKASPTKKASPAKPKKQTKKSKGGNGEKKFFEAWRPNRKGKKNIKTGWDYASPGYSQAPAAKNLLTGLYDVKLYVRPNINDPVINGPVINGQYEATEDNMNVFKKWAEHRFPIDGVSDVTISIINRGTAVEKSLAISFVVSADTEYVNEVINQVMGRNLDDNDTKPIFFNKDKDKDEGTVSLEQQTDFLLYRVKLRLLGRSIEPIEPR